MGRRKHQSTLLLGKKIEYKKSKKGEKYTKEIEVKVEEDEQKRKCNSKSYTRTVLHRIKESVNECMGWFVLFIDGVADTGFADRAVV